MPSVFGFFVATSCVVPPLLSSYHATSSIVSLPAYLKFCLSFPPFAASRNYPPSISQLGIYYQYGYVVEKDLQKAFEYYKTSAELGYSRAQSNLGNMYLNGYGVEKDEKTAVMWCEMSAAQNDKIGQWRLARCYENGTGVEKDYIKAFDWYILSSLQEYEKSQFK